MILRSQDEVAEAKMADLVETYNAMTGKAIKKFESIEIGRVRVNNALLAAENAAGHAGVNKHEVPKPLTVEELKAKKGDQPATNEADDASSTDQESTMSASKRAVKRTATKAARPKAKKEAREVYSKVKFTEPDTTRRPQEGSMRTKVLNALKKRRSATIEQLSEDVKFDARPFVHKLVGQGWAEVVPSA